MPSIHLSCTMMNTPGNPPRPVNDVDDKLDDKATPHLAAVAFETMDETPESLAEEKNETWVDGYPASANETPARMTDSNKRAAERREAEEQDTSDVDELTVAALCDELCGIARYFKMDEDDRNNLCHSIAERYVDTLFERMGAGDVDMVECLQLAKEAVQNNIFTLQWHDRELTSGEQECLLAKCERYVLYFEEISSKLAEDVWARKYASSLGQASNSGGSGYGQGLLRKDKAIRAKQTVDLSQTLAKALTGPQAPIKRTGRVGALCTGTATCVTKTWRELESSGKDTSGRLDAVKKAVQDKIFTKEWGGRQLAPVEQDWFLMTVERWLKDNRL